MAVTAAALRDAGYVMGWREDGTPDFGPAFKPWPPGKKLQCARIEDDFSVTDVFVPLEPGESQETVKAQMPYVKKVCLGCPVQDCSKRKRYN